MRNTARQVQLANDAMTALGNSFNSWLTTTQLRVRMGNALSEQSDLRTVLNRLYMAGRVRKSDGGKHQWKLITASWDRERPFASAGTDDDYNEPEVTEDDQYTEQEPEPEMIQAPVANGTEYAPLYMHNRLKSKVDGIDTVQATDHADIEQLQSVCRTLTESLAATIKKLEAAEAAMKSSSGFVRELTIKKYDGKAHKLKNKVLPAQYQHVLDLARCRRNVLLVGPAGCGKTYLAELIAESLKLPFGAISCTAGMTEGHMTGTKTPNVMKGTNEFTGTEFLEMYEGGGVFLMDELDAADPNMLLVMNTALANGYCKVPHRKAERTAKRHDDFVMIGTANTFGRGATRMYVGRNQLDEATVDRFRIGLVEMTYDAAVESSVCPDDGLDYTPAEETSSVPGLIDRLTNKGYGLRGTLKYVRHQAERGGLRRIVSTRFMQDAHVMHTQADWTVKQIMGVLFSGWTADEVAKVCN